MSKHKEFILDLGNLLNKYNASIKPIVDMGGMEITFELRTVGHEGLFRTKVPIHDYLIGRDLSPGRLHYDLPTVELSD